MVQRAKQIIDTQVKVPVVGVVLNQVPSGTGEDYGYYTNNYSYYSHEGAAGEPAEGAKAGRPADRLEFTEKSGKRQG